METGTAIAIASGVLGVVAIIFRIFPKREQREQRDCAMHSGMEAQIRAMSNWLKRVEEKLDRVIERRETAR